VSALAKPHPARQTPRKRPELLLGALALLGAAAALIALGFRGAFAPNSAPSVGEPVMENPFEEPPATQYASPYPQADSTAIAAQPTAPPQAVGYTGIVVYYTDAAGAVVAVGTPLPDGSGEMIASIAPTQTTSSAPANAAQPTAAPQVPQPQYPVNINTATQAQLETLPGIGPAKAQAILAWRATYGRFNSVAQLIEVSGIGEKTLQNLLPYVTV